jgi:CRISPR-associated endonuclease/helicase Cas3
MTATKPKIIEFANKLPHENEEIQAIELFEDNKDYFKSQHRTQLVPVFEKKITTEELIEFVSEKYSEEGTMLIVVNTIRRSLEVYEELTNRYKNTDVVILYLSTNIIPLSRKKVIDRAKTLIKQKKKMIMVSTQTIEAGVDLDFDQGIRDLAPITSIIQTAGRVNREDEKENHRPLYIVELERDNDIIYDLPEMYSTKKLLSSIINEEDYFDTIDQYYTKQLVSSVSDESVAIIEEGIKKLDYEEVEKFELIKNLPGIVDVFVEYDERATQLADEYEVTRNLLKKTSKDKKYEYKVKLKNTLKQMGNYIISVRTNRLKDGNKPPEFYKRNGIDADFLWIPPDEDDGMYYHSETGFKDESFSAFIF